MYDAKRGKTRFRQTKGDRVATKKKSAPVVKLDDVELNRLVTELGEHLRRLEAIAQSADDHIAEIMASALEIAVGHEQKAEEIFQTLLAYAKEHRSEIEIDGRKSKKIPAGELGFRFSPEAVHVASGKMEAVLARIRELGLAKKLIRTKEELDKDAVKTHREHVERIDGLSIRKSESFFVSPSSCQAPIAGNVRSGKASEYRISERVRWKKVE